ncbi:MULTISPECIES: helix-turn-helix domain-containing protein [Marinomonas]|uniref:Helix-turn-helix transcriptional regulator n=1 Tax=Marinomonas arctica TaxID=383750 RepID=A0A7H1J1C7_9GAMM|nr:MULTISPECIES: helix-turn-helix transcriptional regulator [Marinomonas]MBU1467319.1 helix-turn-helix domain-containing protein [Gammaproteobacteria bacterium]MBU2021837.1 helix-turn-helix domain-containing protein [Gammaproteobacteria bacterium]MBU2237376.1 helix-turn-helix domain-containing protein [Gammaproteobacteria bacterium]MBU2320354.1 helix-turn-helix domain-containing protein [Gammaproteobacteria bacterium]MBU2412211.1 helix-turn-helix domain-containing protein [Gammaproteobacteria 
MQSPLPQRLKSARKLAKLTQEKLSNKLGFDDRSHGTARISQYETGKHAPDFAMAKKMADALGVPVAYLYCDDEKLAELLLVASKLSEQQLDELVKSLS